MNTIIVNPGSGPIAEQGTGWSNTYEGAVAEALSWFERMKCEGMTDITFVEPQPPRYSEGRWTFEFRHSVTGVTVELQTHGIDDLDAYCASRLFGFPPRVYWNGSSTSEPTLQDFVADGFEKVMTFRRALS